MVYSMLKKESEVGISFYCRSLFLLLSSRSIFRGGGKGRVEGKKNSLMWKRVGWLGGWVVCFVFNIGFLPLRVRTFLLVDGERESNKKWKLFPPPPLFPSCCCFDGINKEKRGREQCFLAFIARARQFEMEIGKLYEPRTPQPVAGSLE